MNFVKSLFTKNVNITPSVPDNQTATVSDNLINQVERQKRQIEMCFSLLFELCEKQDKDFNNFVESKSKEYLNKLVVTGFKRYE
jgi:hypothetical protein